MKFGSKLIVDVVSGKFLYTVYTRPCPLPFLHLPVINGGTLGSHQAMLKEFQCLGPPSPQSFSAAPSLTSFYSLIPAPGFYLPCLLSPHSLSIYLWKGHLADGLSSLSFILPLSACLLHISALSPFIPPSTSCPPPTRVSLVVCLSSVEVSFYSELRWKDCFSCVYTKTIHTPFSQNYSGLVRLCTVWFNRCPHSDWISGVICLNLINSFCCFVTHWCIDWNQSYLVVYNDTIHNFTTVISHQGGTWPFTDLTVVLSSGLET